MMRSLQAILWPTKSDAEFWYQQLSSYVDKVENQVHHSDVVQIIDTSKFGPCRKENKFGYESGEPCILLKLNRIFGWEPDCFGLKDDKYDPQLLEEELNEQVEEKGMPLELKRHIIEGVKGLPDDKRTSFLSTVWISCLGEGQADKENIGTIGYYPQQGFPGYYFPYSKQEGYQSPFIFAQIKNPLRGVLLNVECKAFARNIKHDRILRQGSVHFELLID